MPALAPWGNGAEMSELCSGRARQTSGPAKTISHLPDRLPVETIFALSSGAPPAGIAIVRVSGPQAGQALRTIAGALPPPRRARQAAMRDATGGLLDEGLILWFPGPHTPATEKTLPNSLTGGRAVVMAVEADLAALPGLRPARGRVHPPGVHQWAIDLAEAEGLADLLAAETELNARRQSAGRRRAVARVENWRERLVGLSALVEAALDLRMRAMSNHCLLRSLTRSALWTAEVGEALRPRCRALAKGSGSRCAARRTQENLPFSTRW